jgi:hypothetical protein
VTQRLSARASRLATHQAIVQAPRVERRLELALWQLAERWGRVVPDGVLLPIALTHATLGRLVGASRPTVTLALQSLSRDRAVRRREDGSWLLTGTLGDLDDPAAWRARIARPAAVDVVGLDARYSMRLESAIEASSPGAPKRGDGALGAWRRTLETRRRDAEAAHNEQMVVIRRRARAVRKQSSALRSSLQRISDARRLPDD